MTDLFMATVYSATSNGVSLLIPPSTQQTTKLYMRLNSVSLSNGDRVLVAKVDGTYVVIGKVAYD